MSEQRFHVGDVIEATTMHGERVRGDVLVISIADLDGSLGELSDGLPYLVGFPSLGGDGGGMIESFDLYQARVWMAPEQMAPVEMVRA